MVKVTILGTAAKGSVLPLANLPSSRSHVASQLSTRGITRVKTIHI
eukprot:COSAG02_NODE_80_length_40128_cov_591.169002_24_plen_46_part_00